MKDRAPDPDPRDAPAGQGILDFPAIVAGRPGRQRRVVHRRTGQPTLRDRGHHPRLRVPGVTRAVLTTAQTVLAESSYPQSMLNARTCGPLANGRPVHPTGSGVDPRADRARCRAVVGRGRTTHTLDLGKGVDFVAQTNNVQCVGASMQMMLNMIQPGVDRTAGTQLRLQKIARSWSGPRPDGRIRQGAGVRGWAAGLTLNGAGPYRVVGLPTIDEALLVAARAMESTGRPVGLLVWRGRHAWVMSGYKATKDPFKAGARVTAAIVEDPLYPNGSRVWGPSPGARLRAQRQDPRSAVRPARRLLGHAQHVRDVRARPALRIRLPDPSSRAVISRSSSGRGASAAS